MNKRVATFICLLSTIALLSTNLSITTDETVQDELRAISYVESSAGLSPPEWEGGRTELEMGDVNADGKVDIVSIGDHSNPLIGTDQEGIMVWFGDGRGGWTHFQTGHFGYGGIALGDVNNDGMMDVGYAMHHNYSSTDFGDQLIEVALGDGTGQSWIPWDDGLATNGETYGMFSTDLADIDNDADLDVGSVSFGAGNGIHVYRNRGDGTWTQSFSASAGEYSNSSMQFYFGDVNSDGNSDIATSEQNGTVYLGDGYGGFMLADGNLPPIAEYDVRDGVHIGDVNNDGCQDISYINPDGGIEVWLWNGSNTWSDASGTLPDTGSYRATQLCDMDIDGNVDIVAFDTGGVTVWSGNGSGGWTFLTEFTVPRDGTHQAIRAGADADHNAYPDILLVDDEKISLWTYQNFLRFYKEASTSSSLSITPIYPRGKESFIQGSVRFIDWTSGVPAGQDFGDVKLELSTDGSSGPWILIADNLPNNGRHQWVVSADEFSSSCFIRYTVTNSNGSASAVTPAAFQIVPKNSLWITFAGKDDLRWDDYVSSCDGHFQDYNLYRSDWEHFLLTGEYTQDPGAVSHAEQFCHLSTPSVTDAFVPPEGTMVFYLVTGNRNGNEISLGRKSNGNERTNSNPCP